MCQVSQKIVLCKKGKKMSRGTPILAPNFVFCTHNIKMAFSRETTL
jgi:hypothetical protein